MENPFPPFESDVEGEASRTASPQQTRLRDVPFRVMFPNLITLLAIASGLTSIRFAIEQRMELAIAAIILAAFLDGIDGRVARLLKSTTPFGAQMDSLADFVNFGVAPAMLIYFTQLIEARSLGWIAVLIYAICTCLRLARFNVMLDNPNQPEWQKNYFVGIPAPAGALVVLLPTYLNVMGFEPGPIANVVICAYTITIGALMVSTLPTFSSKRIGNIPRDWVLPVMVLFVAVIALLFTYTWELLTVFSLAYLCSLPFSFMAFRRRLAADTQYNPGD